MSKRCFVVQRFDGGRYDSLYDEIFKPAIEEAGFDAYRVDRDPSASIPIETIEREIGESDACFVEMSEDAPNVWFEMGFAIAKEKPLCLVCSTTRTRFPFDVQHRQIIRYPDHPVPSDFKNLRTQIAARLAAVVKSDISLRQNADTAKALSVSPATSGLRPHELLALTIIFQSQLTGGVNGWSLSQDMERGGFTAVASGLAIAGLIRKGYISAEKGQDQDGDMRTDLYISGTGEEWLMEHQDELNLQIEPNKRDLKKLKIDDNLRF
jgi:hypothetical protein